LRGPLDVLLVRAGALGDILLLRRAVAALRARGHGVMLLAPSPAGSVLVGTGLAETSGVIPWEAGETASLLTGDGPPPGAFRDRLRRFGAVIAYTRSTVLLGSLRRLVPRVLARDPAPASGGGHASAWLALPTRELGADPDPIPPSPVATRDEVASARAWRERLPDRFLAVHPGSGSPTKNWPAPRFAKLAPALSEGRPWLLVEGPADVEAAAIAGRAPGAIVARELPPRVLAALLAESSLYVGNDSGVTHLAAAWGAPTLALFGPTDPQVWSPVGTAVRALRAPKGDLERLTVEAVLGAARALKSAGEPPAERRR
jgi:heptosyltransferase III